MLLWRSAQPNNETLRQQQIEGSRLRNKAATSGDNTAIVKPERIFQRLIFQPPKSTLAMCREYLAHFHAAGPFYLAIELDECDTKRRGQSLSKRRLARAPQADEGNAPSVRSILFAKPSGHPLPRFCNLGRG